MSHANSDGEMRKHKNRAGERHGRSKSYCWKRLGRSKFHDRCKIFQRESVIKAREDGRKGEQKEVGGRGKQKNLSPIDGKKTHKRHRNQRVRGQTGREARGAFERNQRFKRQKKGQKKPKMG